MSPIALVTDIDWDGLEIETGILEAAGYEVVLAPDPSPATMARLAPSADVILVCFATLPSAVIEVAQKARAILRYGGGIDNIDHARAALQNIPVYNVPDFCIEEVADHALMLILAITRGLEDQLRTTRSGGWAMPGVLPPRLSTKTLGLVGMGRTGQALARRAEALGMRVLYTMSSRPLPSDIRATQVADLATLAKEADVLSVHVPMTAETAGLINRDVLAMMKPDAIVINVARGGLVVTDDLVSALHDRVIAGAGIDVTDPEPLPEDHPLRTLPQCLVTPHFAYRSSAAITEVRERVARAARDILSGRTPDTDDVSLVT